MTSTELIKDMLERQKAYDAEVFKKHNVDYVSKSQLESALFDELGELMHAQKSDWCWWKFTQEPKDEAKVFEEYIDVVHFALMYEIKFGTGCYQDEDILVWDMDGTFDKENVWVDTWESPDVGVYELESGMDLEGLAWMSLPKPSKEKLEHENNR